MRHRLSALVTGAAAKRLSAVEASPLASNQHEFNGTQPLKQLFGEERSRYQARFVYLGRDDDEIAVADGFVTWYDAREAHPTRSEFRLYYPSTEATSRMATGDLALILRRADGSLLIVFAAGGDTAEQQLLWLFGLSSPTDRFEVKDIATDDRDLGFAAREVLAQLGIDAGISGPADDADLDELLKRFGGEFPTTAEFSAFARATTTDADPVEDPDGTLIAWLEREEALFRQLERHLVLKRLREGFGDDVDGFIAYSLSVQNRRKSRVGYALEHQLDAVFEANGIQRSRGEITERSSRPDFVFPSIQAYQDSHFPVENLAMLGVKSTCKERWRQVLAEADRVPIKHLLTLEPGISVTQTAEMTVQGVVLVIPRALAQTFSVSQRQGLMSVSQLIALLKERQSHTRIR